MSAQRGNPVRRSASTRVLIGAQLGFFTPGHPRTREIPGNPGDEEIQKTPRRKAERVTVTLERAFNLDNNIICVILGKDGGQRTEFRKLQCRHWLIELFRQEVNIVLAGRGFIPTPQQIKLRQHLVRDGTWAKTVSTAPRAGRGDVSTCSTNCSGKW